MREPVGFRSRRARRAWRLELKPWLNVVTGSLFVVPIAFAIEKTTGERGMPETSVWWVIAIGCLVAAAAGAGYALFVRWCNTLLSRNGSFFYLTALPGNDRDLPRWSQAMAHHPVFDSFPGVSRQPIPDLQSFGQEIAEDFKYALRPDDNKTPTNILTNMLWTHAVAASYSMTVRNNASEAWANTSIWYLRDHLGQEHPWVRRYTRQWFADDFIDAIHVPTLLERLKDSGDPLDELRWCRDENHRPLGVHRVQGVDPGTPQNPQVATALVLAVTGPADGNLQAELRSRGVSAVTLLGFADCFEPTGPDNQFLDPDCFVPLVVACQAALAEHLAEHPEGRVFVAARLPKPVAFALGIALASQVNAPAAGRLTLLGFRPGKPYEEFHFAPERSSSLQPSGARTVVNLTPHDVIVVDAAGRALAVFPASGGVSRVGEDIVDERVLQAGSEVPLRALKIGSAFGLPDAQLGTAYIVSRITAMSCPGRSDLLFPHGEVRDGDGRIVGVTGLAHIA